MRDARFASITSLSARIGASEEIAAAVLYLCSDNAKFTTGTSLVVDGGFYRTISNERRINET